MRRSDAVRVPAPRPRHGLRPTGPAGGLAAATLLLLLAAAGGLAAQADDDALRELRLRFDEARAAAVHRLAPDAWEEAAERLAEAARRLERGETGERYRAALEEARARLEAAERLAAGARPIFAEALRAREEAVAAGAEARAPGGWERAEQELGAAGERFEDDDRQEAAERSVRAAELYRRAAGAARRERLLGPAIQARQAAIARGAEELAAATFREGSRLLEEAEADVAAGRAGEATAETGEQARTAFERAAEVAALADSVLRRQVPVERLVLEREADLAELARAAGQEHRAGEPGATVGRIDAEIGRLRGEVRRLERELADARAEAERRSERIARLEEELAEAERRLAETRDDLLALRRRDERLREAQALFTPEEGEVVQAGDRLALRLFGLTFESGSAEILEEHRPLLTKVERVIRTFDDARVLIEGHTDAQGSADANRALSQRRAIAVREHLLQRLPLPASRVEARGLGEDRPIASNETEEGRARNRRIEVVLMLAGASGGP